jgi:hypothetical protein
VQGAWSPSLNIATVLSNIQLLLAEPNPDDGLMAEITQQFRIDRHAFNEAARAQTLAHAIKKADDLCSASSPASSESLLSSSAPNPSASSSAASFILVSSDKNSIASSASSALASPATFETSSSSFESDASSSSRSSDSDQKILKRSASQAELGDNLIANEVSPASVQEKSTFVASQPTTSLVSASHAPSFKSSGLKPMILAKKIPKTSAPTQ